MVFGIQVNEDFWKKKNCFPFSPVRLPEAWQIGGEGVKLAMLGADCFAKETELNLALIEKYWFWLTIEWGIFLVMCKKTEVSLPVEK